MGAFAPPKLGHVRSSPGLGLWVAPRLACGPCYLRASSLSSFAVFSPSLPAPLFRSSGP